VFRENEARQRSADRHQGNRQRISAAAQHQYTPTFAPGTIFGELAILDEGLALGDSRRRQGACVRTLTTSSFAALSIDIAGRRHPAAGGDRP
jgi:hypothetical protein